MLWGRGVLGPTGPDQPPIYGSIDSKSRHPLDHCRMKADPSTEGTKPLQGVCHEPKEYTSLVRVHRSDMPLFLEFEALYWGHVVAELRTGSWFRLIEALGERAALIYGLLVATSSLVPSALYSEGSSGVYSRYFGLGSHLLDLIHGARYLLL
jgi:hypothetical protein